MAKVTYQLAITVVLFFGLWFGLKSIDWMELLSVKKAATSTEEKLGELLWKVIAETEYEEHDSRVIEPIDTLINRLCQENSIDVDKIKLHVIRKDEINAFVLPNSYLIVYTGLIADAENEAEVLGVLGHEIAHIEKAHVMKKLMKEIGLSVLVSITSGGGSETVSAILKMLSSSAYDREYESEADLASVDYLISARINPEPFAGFLYRMSFAQPDLPEEFYWLSTHPESKERAENIISYIKGKTFESDTVLQPLTWSQMKSHIEN